MKQSGGMLQLASLAHDGGFAIAVGLSRRDAQSLHATLTQQGPEFLSDGDQFIQTLMVGAGVRVADDRHRQGPPGRRRDGFAALGVGFVHRDDQFSDVRFHVVMTPISAPVRTS